jgi:para-aminobenzoate synthetase component 1
MSMSRPAPLSIHPLSCGLTAWEVAQRLADLPHLLFLDSAEFHHERGRYSYVMAAPTEFHTSTPAGVDAFAFLKQHLPKLSPTLPGLPPFQTGFAGLFGYELNSQLEAIKPRTQPPMFAVGRYDWVFAFDHPTKHTWLLARPEAKAMVPKVLDLIHGSAPTLPPRSRSAVAVQSNVTRDQYIAAVAKGVEYIHAGDIFQVNLSQQLSAKLSDNPLSLYDTLRRVSPAPFAAYFDLGKSQLLSASPERFLVVDSTGKISTRPIKGTRPRGATPTEDEQIRRELKNNPKDHAENVMIVDLLRNDIGKVAKFGSVKVPKVCELETFGYVHHLVSEVTGQLRDDATALDLLRASFPGGSITGAPKVRAMEIIRELETHARGAYCGSIGFLSCDGAMDTNILIRTITLKDGVATFPMGGGIVADSKPETEYDETLHKSAGIRKALNPHD